MKRSLLLLFCVLSVAFAGLAQSITGVTPETVNVDLSNSTTVDLTLGVDPTYMSWNFVYLGDAKPLLLTSADATEGIACDISKGASKVVTLTIPSSTPEGNYYLKFPQGAFKLSDGTLFSEWVSAAPVVTITGGGGEVIDYSEYFEGAYVEAYGVGNFTQIDGFYIYFPALKGVEDLSVTISDPSKVTLNNGTQVHVSRIEDKEGVPAAFCWITSITEPGDYVLTVGEGAFKIGETLNPEIVSPKFVVAAQELKYYVYPSAKIIGFGSTIEIEFENPITDIHNIFGLQCLVGGDVNTLVNPDVQLNSKSIFFHLNDSYAKVGEFPLTITLAEGSFSCGGIDNQVIEISDYTVKREYIDGTVAPESGKYETMPTEVTVTFDQWLYAVDGEDIVVDGAVLYNDGVEVAKFDVVNDWGDEGSVLTVKIEGDFEDGDYKLTIPEGLFGGDELIAVNPQYVLNYKVGGPTGIEAISGEANNFTVVDCAGRVVVSNGGLNGLEKGLYIVNGKKVAIR